MKRIRIVLTALVVALLASASALAAPASAESLVDVTVVVEPLDVSIDLGTSFDITVTMTNGTTRPVTGLVAHIDITALDSESSVDPEDWTSTLSRSVSPLEPGQSATLSWTLQPIAAGQFTVYAVGLAPEATDVSSSNVLVVNVADRRSLNPNGILPVSISLPVVVGGLLVTQQRRGRRT